MPAQLLGVALAIAAGAGVFIFWNTNVRNTYRTRFSREEAQAQYEKRYKAALRRAVASRRSPR